MTIIIAIAWIYVVLMMSITEASLIAGIMTFLLYCVFPLTIFMYLLRTPGRRTRQKNGQGNQPGSHDSISLPHSRPGTSGSDLPSEAEKI